MCRHIVDLKDSGKKCTFAEVNEIVDMVVRSSTATTAAILDKPAEHDGHALVNVHDEWPSFGEGEGVGGGRCDG